MPKETKAVGKLPPVTAEGPPVTGTNFQSHPDSTKPVLVQVNHHPVTPSHSLADDKSPSQRVTKLIGKKCLLKCHLSGYAVTVLLDSGAQVSIIDRSWKHKYLPQQEVLT